ncbi:helix-turn-helix transcriptional regulator [Anaerotignum lactatifermentans]|uniref:Helix-turn-helix transcriptional regulator n=1 Tax=Anaerotignum lactatifermentans TaxID=160404 RepID=A0ABS2GDV1_9FIRM|nr:helix-turn-helix transcriptional regulator [Anaerotignum lactatifermentans]MBM6830391.1 helix-turn-helix transcriptional regulator [Anaerotignum lactatifermentans]MBM6878958.1 helix-turn-helix transcriptional regulator [Anaerotignum lactatifermentans]MBM6951953.1 helix-turn-helix transcriptional regulator [Anaerotignum lactatifermentans]
MLNKLREFRALNAFVKKQSVGMQRKLMFYWVSMILVVFMAVILLLSIAGAFSWDDEQLHEVMELQLKNTQDNLESHLDHLTAQSLNLSKELSREIEGVLVKEGISMQEVNDDPKRLLKLQEVMYPLINATLQTANCNGAYAILDATTNTGLEIADHSRSGIHLRYSNLSASSPVTPTVVYFRGIPDIAWQKDLELHNRWNLEFDTDQIPGCRELMNATLSRPAERYFWSHRIDLKDTWESTMLLCVPIVGGNGTVYGVCGVEISALYFQFSYPTVEGQFGSAVTVLAPIQDNRLRLADGLVGSAKGTYLSGKETLTIHRGRYYNEYDTGTERYIGLHQAMPISNNETEDTVWAVVVLIHQDSYDAYTAGIQKTWIVAAMGLLLILLALSFFLSQRFVRPITESLKRFQQEEMLEQGISSGISEVDELAGFLNARARNQRLEQGELPPNIAELFDQFIERKGLLTEAERNILRYYIDGHEIAEIPELAFISMSTVRKHNRNIYEKLGVASRDELMLYIDLLRRCGRLEELF